ncbi:MULTISPECIES: nitroreductase family protein [unclassified Listeria]|uniref:nitroreductase family protein n=1 Tax=unclassified Listeria TaxID=2642072 RepID=UPI000B593049|nr:MULTISPECIES: nitroreductase family protein [unclassified Listeria]
MYKNNDFQDLMKNRRSIRAYDENVKISHEEMLEMINEATTAPSSVNMQPWRFVVADTAEAKAKLRPLVRFNTTQNDTSSAMIILFGDKNAFENGEKIYGTAVAKGLMPQEVKDKQLPALRAMFASAPESELERTSLIDGGLVAMQFMLVARAYGYDTNPIGGFERDEVAEAFDMDTKRYTPIMILSIGKAKDAGYPSYRLDATEITSFK